MASSCPGTRGAGEPIAVIGSGCRFPGSSNNPSKLWELLQNPCDLLTKIPENRFNADRFYHPDPSHHGTTNVTESYFLQEDHRVFDAGFFNVKQVEAHALDPQQRMLMETIYESLEAAGLSIESLAGSQTAVYVGLMCGDYSEHLQRDLDSLPTYMATGTARSIMSNRISYFFDWHGPCMTIDTACSSSLVAVHQAVQLLRSGESDVAVAAGSNLIFGPELYIGESKLKMLSPNSRSRMWDIDADGYARGEGVAAVILKRLSSAIADGDHIECIIRESGVNQDGRTKGITMPSQIAQAELIRKTYTKAGLDPQDPSQRCQYFEAHGTGTPAGDPKEAEAISTAFFDPGYRRSNAGDPPLYVGSVKTVIGHTEGTAGIAGLLKASLAVQHGIIPPNLLFNTLHPAVEPFYTNLEIPTTAKTWPKIPDGSPRRASVNSFGFGGTNAHVIIENYLPEERAKYPMTTQFTPFVFSASSEQALLNLLSSYFEHLNSNPSLNPQDLAYTLQARRTAFPVRVAIPATSIEELHSKIGELIESSKSGESHGIGMRSKSLTTTPGVLGVFTGQGAQWATMGRELISKSKYVREMVQAMDSTLQTLPKSERPVWSLMDELMADASTSRLDSAMVAQPLCTVIQIILLELLRSAGVKFSAVIGHSSGEIAAAYAAGVIGRDDAVKIAYYRGFFSNQVRTEQPGAMMAVGTSLDDATELCSLPALEGRLCVAAINSHSSVTLSGDCDAIEEAKEIFEDEKKFARILKVDKAYHSRHMIPCSAAYLKALQRCCIKPQQSTNGCVWFSSTYENTRMEATKEIAGTYWRDNMIQPVLFSQAVEAATAGEGPFHVAVEVGPHPTLKGPVLQNLQDIYKHSIPYTGLLSRGVDDIMAFSQGLSYLWTQFNPAVVEFNGLDALMSGTSNKGQKLATSLPSYPWDHDTIFWHESRASRAFKHQKEVPNPLLGTRLIDQTKEEIRWRNLLQPSELPWIHGHQLQGQMVYPAAAYLSTAVEAARFLASNSSVAFIEIEDFDIGKPLTFDNDDSGIETIFTLNNISQDSANIVSASFTYHASTNVEVETLTTHATGKVIVTVGETSSKWLPHRIIEPPNMINVNENQFYTSLDALGYGYSGDFRSLSAMKRKKDFGIAELLVPQQHDNSAPLLIHPALLDSALQGLFLAYCFPNDGDLEQLHVPVGIKRLCVNVGLCHDDLMPGMNVTLSSHLTENPLTSNNIQGDVDIFSADGTTALIQIEGIKVVFFSEPTPETDSKMFSEHVWGVISPDCELVTDNARASADDYELAIAMERVSIFYIKRLDELIDVEEREQLNLEEHHVCLFNFVSHVLSSVQEEKLPFAQKEWLDDSWEDIVTTKTKWNERIDMRIVCAVGENLPAAVRRETTMLEHLLADNMFNYFFEEGMGPKEATGFLAKTVAQVVHRYPQMKILEIGAGTGGATKAITKTIGRTFSSYTFTDISTGFFEAAQEVFTSLGDKMVFKTLDIENDIVEQGYEEHSYDLVIGSMVLHATSDLQKTLENTRRLLKPGGYLMITEITNNDIIRIGFSMSGLPGWWLGQKDGRTLSPCISSAEWHKLLLRSGFSGIDSMTPECDVLTHPMTVIVSQAVDDQIITLREPLLSLGTRTEDDQWDLVLIGGKTMRTIPLLEQITSLVRQFDIHVTCFASLEDVDPSQISQMSAVLSLTELDSPVFKNLSDETMSGMKRLFETQRTVLWITQGCRADEPFMNMTIGFGRSLVLEIPDLCLQFLDLESSTKLNPRQLLEYLLRLHLSNKWEKEYRFQNVLWTHEQEVVWEKERLMIPRLYFNQALNDRYNASKRTIMEQMSPQVAPLILQSDLSKYDLVYHNHLATFLETPQAVLSESEVLVKVSHSLLLPITASQHEQIFCVLGINTRNEESVIAFTAANGSFVIADSRRVFQYASHLDDKAHLLSTLDLQFRVDNILTFCGSNSTLLVHEPSTELAARLTERASDINVSVFFTTSRSDRFGESWITFHPHTPSRMLKSLLPSNLSLFIDCSTTSDDERVGANIAFCLPQTCYRTTIGEIQSHAHYRKLSADHLIIKFRDITDRALAESAKETSPSSAVTVGLQSLAQKFSAHPTQSTVIEWSSSTKVAVKLSTVDSQISFKKDNTYVLFGLTSDLAQSTCDWMVSHGARNIVLTSRTPRIDSRWKEELEKKGVRLEAISNDITDKAALTAVVVYIRQNFPPIAGIAHGAMVLDDTSFFEMSLEKMQKVLRPKVLGAIYLDELFQDNSLDFFIFFSSVAAIIGNRGQSAYSTANMFMTSLAAQRRERGLAASILHIGVVIGVGYVTRELIDTLFVTIRKAGFMWMSERGFHLCFGEAMLASNPLSGRNPEVVTGLNTITTEDTTPPPWAKFPRFQHCIQEYEAKDTKGYQKMTTISTRAQLAKASSEKAIFEIIQDGLFSKLHLALQLPLDADRSRILSSGADELGVDSLVAVEIRSWLLKELDIDMPILKILSGGSMADLIQHAVEKLPVELTPEMANPNIIIRPIAEEEPELVIPSYLSEESASLTSTTSRSEKTEKIYEDRKSSPNSSEILTPQYQKILPMSSGQSRFWFLKHMIDNQSTANITVSVTIQGTIRLNDLETAIDMMGTRHEALRTSYFTDENQKPMQAVSDTSLLRLEKLSITDESQMMEQFESLKNYVFDIERGESMRIIHLSLTPTMGYILLGCHHINLDGVSLEIFLNDLEKAYNRQTLPEPVYQYSDYTTNQLQQLENGEMKEELEFWKGEFADTPSPLPLLPFSSTTSRLPIEYYSYSVESRKLSPSLAMQIKDLCRRQKANFFQFYLTVFEVTLFKLLETRDLCIGMADANRIDEKVLQSMGMYLNLLPLRFQLDASQSFEDLLKNTRRKVYIAMAHSRLPFDVLVDQINTPRSTTHSPLFQAFINFRRGVSEKRKFGTATGLTGEMAVARTPYDITLDIMDNPGGETRITFMLQKQLYSDSDAKQLTDIYFNLLKQFSSSPKETLQGSSMFSSDSISNAAKLGQGPTSPSKWPATLVHRIDDIIAKQPGSVALKEASGKTWTYQQMADNINKLAAALMESKVVPKSYVVVFQEPSSSFIFSLLAILRIGAIYVPFDCTIPTSRLASIVKVCNPSAIIIHEATMSKVVNLELSQSTAILNLSNLADRKVDRIPIIAEAHHPAMVLFTSGTTGVPKGVILSHSGLKNHAEGVASTNSVGPEAVLQQSAFSFDLSVYQTFLALANGGSLVIVPRSLRGDPVALARIITEDKITYTIATPSEYVSWFRHGRLALSHSKNWKFAEAGGEPYPVSLLRDFQKLASHFRHSFHFFNIYGPCENSLSSHQTELSVENSLDERLSVGKPLPNYSVLIVDNMLKPLPVGFPGEICIGGAGVAIGYLNLPEETRKKFVKDPHASSFAVRNGWINMYRTGDRGLLRPNGALEIHGRIDGDTQIKLRGIRIEIEDIEKTILGTANGALSEIVIAPRGDPPILIGYAVLSPNSSIENEANFLQQLAVSLPLPQYMKPAAIISVKSIPLTGHGKIDRNALERLPIAKTSEKPSSAGFLTDMETRLSQVWEQTLPKDLKGVYEIDATSDFFHVGGNSMLIIKLRKLIKDVFGTDLSIMRLFEGSTLSIMAAAIQNDPKTGDIEIDWDVETELSADVLDAAIGKQAPTHPVIPRTIVMTGSTGFLGQHILRALIESSEVETIHCIAVRSDRKLEEFISSGKIIVHQGDLSLPRCGLSETESASVFSSADAIIHNGADVSFLKTYRSLKLPNLSSTKELVKLSLPRQIPFHFISTATVGQLNGTDTLELVSMVDFPPPPGYNDGYAASKWASEIFLEKAHAQLGLPVFIHRPSSVIGEGVGDMDIMSNVMKFAPMIKAMPDPRKWRGYLDMISVENATAGILKTVLQKLSNWNKGVQYVHHSGDVQVPVHLMKELMDGDENSDLTFIPIKEWIEKAKEHGMSNLVAEYLSILDVDGRIIGQKLVN